MLVRCTWLGVIAAHAAHLAPRPQIKIAGNIDVDREAIDFCDNMTDSSEAAQGRGVGRDKIWLFIQSGPHTGSTLLYEVLSGCSDVSPLCRNEYGEHAEGQYLLDADESESKFPNWASLEIWDYPNGNKDSPGARGFLRYIREPEWTRTLALDNFKQLPSMLKGFWLRPMNQVRLFKSPSAAFSTAAFRQEFGGNARFLVLVRDPYAHIQHLKQEYFDTFGRTRGYRGAMHVVGDLFRALHEAVLESSQDMLVIRYEDFTERPDECLTKIHTFVPEIGNVPLASKMSLLIHDRKSKIKNMNDKYLRKLPQKYRKRITKYLRQYEAALSFFGYKPDSNMLAV